MTSRREDKVSHVLLWVTAKNRSTKQPETMGLWTGSDSKTFVIDGESRVYHGPAAIDIEPVQGGIGLDVRQYRIPLPDLSPEVTQMLRQYEARFAPVEVHFVEFSLATRQVERVTRVFKGWINSAPISTPEEGGEGLADLVLVSASRQLTKPLAIFRSNADQKKRDPNDTFRLHSSTSGLKEVWWGEQKTTGGA